MQLKSTYSKESYSSVNFKCIYNISSERFWVRGGTQVWFGGRIILCLCERRPINIWIVQEILVHQYTKSQLWWSNFTLCKGGHVGLNWSKLLWFCTSSFYDFVANAILKVLVLIHCLSPSPPFFQTYVDFGTRGWAIFRRFICEGSCTNSCVV